MKILLVGPGMQPIPPLGWGGVENLIWQQKMALENEGHSVEIFNHTGRITGKVLRLRPWRFDVVHLHHDFMTPYWIRNARLFRFSLVVSTHDPYAAWPNTWHSNGYDQLFQKLCLAADLILLTHEMRQAFLSKGCPAKLFVLPLGIHCRDIRCSETAAKQGIVLGKIQPRKFQASLARALDGRDVDCDFVGPIADDTFAVNNVNTHYLGEWNRAQIRDTLTCYSCMVLLSEAEGQPAVLVEALAAGLSLVISPQAAHNLDTTLPWIFVVDPASADLADVIQQAVRENHRYRREIRLYCERHFDWSVIAPEYVNILTQVSQGRPTIRAAWEELTGVLKRRLSRR